MNKFILTKECATCILLRMQVMHEMTIPFHGRFVQIINERHGHYYE